MQLTRYVCFALCLLFLAHFKMSSAWERIRLRVETKENISEAMNETRTISTHILDTTLGKAAANVTITLYRLENSQWQQLSEAATNADGRVAQLLSASEFKSGIYKLHFAVRAYFERLGVSSFYPFVEIVVECVQGQHYHVPLLLNPYGYATYRGT